MGIMGTLIETETNIHTREKNTSGIRQGKQLLLLNSSCLLSQMKQKRKSEARNYKLVQLPYLNLLESNCEYFCILYVCNTVTVGTFETFVKGSC